MRFLALLLGLLLLAGCAAEPRQVTGPPPTVASSTAPSPGPAPSEPTEIDISKIAAHSTLVPLGLNPDGTIQVPPVSTPRQAGWYSYGPTPGEIGPAVIVGHVDGNNQKGIFYRLKELAPGDRISVSRKDGSAVVFVVREVDQVDKDAFPENLVYGNTSDAELRLITCGGSFDRTAHSYVDNVIVYAGLA
ncbi:MAG TPA: class F sortase [Amycolatopsis sp.]|jgi:hypothetical protein|nr:class F sortase [Amycolatopsis sp.]